MLDRPRQSKIQYQRIQRIFRICLHDFDLNLDGLTVYTEAATGPYLYTPVLAALAGADTVYALAKESSYGTLEDVKRRTMQAAVDSGVADRLHVVCSKAAEHVEKADIITNSGFVRPIDREMISWMKPTAVIPLMWETWEWSHRYLDLDACREKGILVMGTNESACPPAMFPYAAFVAMKMLFELGLEGYKTRTLLLGGRGLAKPIIDCFRRSEMEYGWFSDWDDEARPYRELREHFLCAGAEYDALLVADHVHDACLLGKSGLLSYEEIREINPALGVGIISGKLDIKGLEDSGLNYFPDRIQPFGTMSYQPADLGPRPVLELYAAGLKVGQVMARSRKAGIPVQEAARKALANSPAMDFGGDRSWLSTKIQ